MITRAVSRDDPAYVRKQLERGTPFRVVRRAGEVVACASADLVHGAKTAELTDVATAPSARGEGLAKACLAGLLDDLQALGFPTAYTLSRVAEPGINRAFARLGFVWRGSMRSSCRIGDGHRVWQLVERLGGLEPNTCYAYLLLTTHFGQTCVVAERETDDGTQLLGFVMAYRPPPHLDALFVWQVGVTAEARGLGLGKRLLRAALALPACADVRWLEATVGTSNTASQRLFSSVARDLGVGCAQAEGFIGSDFGPLHHEDETLFRIGPLSAAGQSNPSNQAGTPATEPQEAS